MTLTRRQALIHLLDTLEDALGPDQCANARSAGGGSPEHRMSRQYHEGSYHDLERALHWLKSQHQRWQVNGENTTGRILWHHVTAYHFAPYTIRYGCPICHQIAPPEGAIHRHRDRGIIQKVVSQPIRVYRREPWVRRDLVEAGIDRLLERMPDYIRVPAAEEAA